MEMESCPLCGALPCDWVDNPHKVEVGLCWTLAKIREALGVNEKPMMDELPGILTNLIEQQAAEIARLREELSACGYFVGNADGTKWRTWEDGWPTWTSDLGRATIYRTRHDAEQIHLHDEDAWRIVSFIDARQALKGQP